jgi:hypothetical protein
MQSPYRSPSGTQPHFLIKGVTVPSELAQSAGGLAFIFSRAMCVRSSSFSVTAHDPLTFVVVAFLLMAVAIVAGLHASSARNTYGSHGVVTLWVAPTVCLIPVPMANLEQILREVTVRTRCHLANRRQTRGNAVPSVRREIIRAYWKLERSCLSISRQIQLAFPRSTSARLHVLRPDDSS